MAFSARHLISLAVVLVALVATAGVFTFARPAYRAESGGTTIHLPPGTPAADAAGAAGWAWPDGTPGWQAGARIQGYLVSGVQPVELDTARLAAARAGLDSDSVRVLTSTRANRRGPLAILAAPTTEQSPASTCLAAMLQGDQPVRWQCPANELEHQRVLVAAARYTWPDPAGKDRHPLYLVGVARGDVRRVELVARGLRQTLYERGPTWGQFDAAVMVANDARLRIYGRRGLVQTISLTVRPGTQRIFG